jgi:hypothetical protein
MKADVSRSGETRMRDRMQKRGGGANADGMKESFMVDYALMRGFCTDILFA